MSNVTTISIDLAKSVFHICGLNQAHIVIFNKFVKLHQLIDQIQAHPNTTIAMEVCSNSHHWAKTCPDGPPIKLIPAQRLKAFLRGQKNDINDALIIAEDSFRPRLHCVSVKSIEQ